MRFPLQTKDRGYTLFIWQDIDPLNPREFCNSKMYCWHPRYSLGDENPYSSFTEFKKSQEAQDIRISLPVYLLDHSGLYVSCTDFQDPWDSGRVGIIFYTDSTIKAEYGDETLDDKTLLMALKREVKEYDDYLNGIWVGYTIDDPDGIVVESCGGFYLDTYNSVLKEMKENSDEQFYALFEKMEAQISSKDVRCL